MLYIETEEISNEIQNVLAKHNVTIDLIDDVLDKTSFFIKSRTTIKKTPVAGTTDVKIDLNKIMKECLQDLTNHDTREEQS